MFETTDNESCKPAAGAEQRSAQVGVLGDLQKGRVLGVCCCKPLHAPAGMQSMVVTCR